MNPPKVSVILPAYNQAPFLDDAIESLLKQTFEDWELIVVDDGSMDFTREVVFDYPDPRIHYLYQENRGLPGARNAGIDAARGDYLAFLDADDFYHPQKLALQAARLDADPQIGLTYASRIGVDQDGRPVWMLRAPADVNLEHLVLGFPFTINDLMVRREWVEKVGGFDPAFRLHSEDRDWYLRLALAGCRFAHSHHFVSYRRLHAGRKFTLIPERIEAMQRALETAFSHPDCPEQVLALRPRAQAKVYLYWILKSMAQGETGAAQEYVSEVARLAPELIYEPSGAISPKLVDYLVWFSVRDGGDHVETLRRIFAALPAGLAGLQGYKDFALGQGHLLCGGRALIWGRNEEGRRHFEAAARLEARADRLYLDKLADQLSAYEWLAGRQRAEERLRALGPYLRKVASRADLRHFARWQSIARAYKDFRRGRYQQVPGLVMKAAIKDPGLLFNRGVMSIFFRSLLRV